VTVLDPDREWVAERQRMGSKASNSPFLGWRHKGKAVATIVGGKIVWRDDSADPARGEVLPLNPDRK